MNLTEMIVHLEKLRAECGDIEIEANDEYGGQTAITEADVCLQTDVRQVLSDRQVTRVYIDM